MPGLGHWTSQLAKGTLTFEDVVNEFMASDEFINTYGENLSNEDFINLLYSNVLGREPDKNGFENWLEALESGSLRADVLLGFSDSDEQLLTLLYDAAFNRSPDENDIGHWINQLARSDIELEDIVELFIVSEEFQALYGEVQSDDDLIESLYQNTLDRHSDQEGKGHWLGLIASDKMDYAELLVMFAESTEHVDIMLTGNGTLYADGIAL